MKKVYSKPKIFEYKWFVNKTIDVPTEEFTDPIKAAEAFISYQNDGWMPHMRVEKNSK